MVIDAAGQVGIGTDSPSSELEIAKPSGYSTLTLSSAANINYGGGGLINIKGGITDYTSFALNVQTANGTQEASMGYSAGAGRTWAFDANQRGTATSGHTSYNFKNNGFSQMVIYDNNVGIGMTSPAFKLEVDNGGIGVPWDSTGITFVNFQTVGSSIKSNTSSDLIFNTRLISAPYTESARMRILNNGNVGINVITPQSKLQVDGGIQMANDDAAPSADKVGTLRYRASATNSYVDMCMQTGAATYAWVNIKTNNF
jgi:hypothetical protein